MTANMLHEHMKEHMARFAHLARFVFPNAPYVVPWKDGKAGKVGKAKDSISNFTKEEVVFAWFNFVFPDDGGHWPQGAEGFDGAVAAIAAAQQEEVERHGRGFDGIMGFSQGAITCSMLAALGSESVMPVMPRFCIFAGGCSYAVFEQSAAALFERVAPIKLPSLHMFGKKDTTVPAEVSELLVELFDERGRVACEHAGGHVVPSDEASLQVMEAFLLAQHQNMAELSLP